MISQKKEWQLSFVIVLMFMLMSWNCFSANLSERDKNLLELIEKNTFHYFWDEANTNNGLIPDATKNRNASISVVGFGLAAICIADARGWITHDQAYHRVLKTLQSFVAYSNNPSTTKVQAEHGHHYHWIDPDTGEWCQREGIYATDTAGFIAGVLTVGEYFKGTEIEKLADMIYKNVDWTWFYDKKANGLYIGWTPSGSHGGLYTTGECGTFITLLAIGSPTYPIPVESWTRLGSSYVWSVYKEYTYIGDATSYTHQWPFCFIDPSLKKDYFLDYFQNLREFSLASRQWCLDFQEQGYSANVWGLNVCAGPDKYGDYGAPVIPGASGYNGKDNDGTVAPTAALSFMPFTPEESCAMAKYIYTTYKNNIFGDYGFFDSFNIPKNFWSSEYLGIDQGPIVIMIDNYLHGTVWKSFMANKYMKKAIARVGFSGIIDNFDESAHSPPYAQWTAPNSACTFSRSQTQFKEGKTALRVHLDPKKATNQITVTPLLKNFSDYPYFGFWKFGNEPVKVYAVDSQNKRQELKLLSTTRDNNWDLVYYSIAGLKINQNEISRIVLSVPSRSVKAGSDLYLDFLHLSKKHLFQTPSAPLDFTAQKGIHGGEVDLKFRYKKPDEEKQGLLCRYIVKKSEHPITNKNLFLGAESVIENYFPALTNKIQAITVADLTPGKRYYFAIAGENNVYNMSEIASASAIANPDQLPVFSFGASELVDFSTNEWTTFSSDQDMIEKKKVRKESQEALQLDYKIQSGADLHWVGVKKDLYGKMPATGKISFFVKAEGLQTKLEFKLVDKAGAVFRNVIDSITFDGKWQKVSFDIADLVYCWGGEGNQKLTVVSSVELAFVTDETGSGSVVLHKLKLK